MAEITEDIVRHAYEIARSVMRDEIKERDAVRQLSLIYNMSPGSASDYIRNLRQMLNGEVFHRTIKLFATGYYLNSIREDFGEIAYRNSLKSFEGHLNYYESLSKGGARPSHRALLVRHKANLEIPSAFEISGELEADVARASQLSSDERLRLLAKAPRKPERKTATITVFTRNPVVIAEVLARAGGHCEVCLDSAPFLKKKDGTPYLEVHHKVRLADDGDDTIGNAIALCPNCHRRKHYG